MKNILVVNVNWLGDAVFSTPVFKALKEAYPQARLVCLCLPRVKEVLEHCPWVDAIIVYDEKGKGRTLWGFLTLIARLRKERFDAAFVLHRSMTRGLLVYLAGIPLRIGYGKCQGLLTHPLKSVAEGIHRSDYYLKVVQAYGIKVHNPVCVLTVDDKDVTSVHKKLFENGWELGQTYVVLNTGGNWHLKCWSRDSFVLLAKRLHEDFALRIVFSGANKDKDNCQWMAQQAGVFALSLAGQTSLGESLALYQQARVVISGDSGPLHLAHSVGADVIGIFGPTRPEITGPKGRGVATILFNRIGCNQAPCYHLTCQYNRCMVSVTVDDVYQAFKRMQS